MTDQINHPPHYPKAGGIEAIDVIEAFELNYRLGNVIKYVLRAGRKGGPEQYMADLWKARWYLDRELSGAEGVESPGPLPIPRCSECGALLGPNGRCPNALKMPSSEQCGPPG